MGPSLRAKTSILRSERGFTLVEMLVVLGITIVLTSIAFPSLIKTRVTSQLRAATSEFYVLMNRAKIEAVRRNGSVSVVFFQLINGRVYDFVSFTDLDNDLEFDEGSDQVIDKLDLSTFGKHVYFNTAVNGNGVSFTENDENLPAVRFTARGLSKNNGGGFGAGTIYLINSNGDKKEIVVNAIGSVRVDG